MDEKTIRDGVLQISKNLLDGFPMNITGIMRELGYLIYIKSYV